VNYNIVNQREKNGCKVCIMCGTSCRYITSQKGSKDAAPFIGPKDRSVCSACQVVIWVFMESKLQFKWCNSCRGFLAKSAFNGKTGKLLKTCTPCCTKRRALKGMTTAQNGASTGALIGSSLYDPSMPGAAPKVLNRAQVEAQQSEEQVDAKVTVGDRLTRVDAAGGLNTSATQQAAIANSAVQQEQLGGSSTEALLPLKRPADSDPARIGVTKRGKTCKPTTDGSTAGLLVDNSCSIEPRPEPKMAFASLLDGSEAATTVAQAGDGSSSSITFGSLPNGTVGRNENGGESARNPCGSASG